MRAVLSFASRNLDAFNDFIGRTVAWLTALMVVLVVAIVLLRYGFDLGWIAMQELVLYFHACVFCFGAAYTLKNDGHVRVDVYYRRFSPCTRAWVNLIGHLVLLMPQCIFIFAYSLDYVLASWRILESSQEAGGLPALFLFKSLLLVLPLCLLLQSISEVLKLCIELQKKGEGVA